MPSAYTERRVPRQVERPQRRSGYDMFTKQQEEQDAWNGTSDEENKSERFEAKRKII